MTDNTTKKLRGFAALSVEDRKKIASRGGKKAHTLGKAHTFTSEEARQASAKSKGIGARAGKKHDTPDT